MLDEAKSQWRVGQFGEIAKVKSGFAFKSQDFCDPSDDSVAVIRMSDLKQGRVTWETAKNVPATVVAGLERFQLSAGDFLFGMSGSLGNYGIVPSADRPIFLNQRVGKLEPVGSSGSFLAFLFTSERFLSEIERRASGNAQANISGKQIESIEVDIPPLPEQERIAEILTSVDDSIRATEAVIAQAERVKRGLMEDLLTGGLGSEAIARGEVPEGWERKALKDVAQVITGKTPSTKVEENWGGRTPFITPSDLNHAVYIDNAERFVSDQALEKLKLLPENTLLYTCIASIGKSAIARVPCVTNQQINACVFRQTIAPLFAYYQLQLRTGEVEALAGKTAVAIINKGKFSSFEMIFPKTAEQSSISAAIGSIDEQIRASRGTIDQLQRLKRGLMDDLLSGRVRTV